jgi:hypothetical protein
MPFSLDLGAIHRCPQRPDDPVCFTRNTPRRVFALTSPHSANIDHAKIEQQCGGILARLQPVYARGKEFWKRISGVMACGQVQAVDRASPAGYFSDESRQPTNV